ncbi:MAG: hypothetical protein CMH36_08875 [Microbacterium sp.]|uniref:hypothetical protein n=1 Tax=Microbacterium sp. 4NA327F11 TaxID=2502229 RepID=UPI000C93D66D|nr:hypothetical protein [Microbacterium sp. 4NA327F11]MAL06924.1 hypothetical protein [Microbacterium sp.]
MTDAPTIGVVGNAHVAAALHELGFHVVTGDAFRPTATELSNRLSLGEEFPIVVCDDDQTLAIEAWTISTARRTHVVVLGTRPGVNLLAGSPNRLELPATVNDLLASLRYEGTPRPIGSHIIEPDGTVHDLVPAAAPSAPTLRPLPGSDSSTFTTTPPPSAPPAHAAAEESPAGTVQGFPEGLFRNIPAPANTAPVAPPEPPRVAPELPIVPTLPVIPARDDAAPPEGAVAFTVEDLDDIDEYLEDDEPIPPRDRDARRAPSDDAAVFPRAYPPETPTVIERAPSPQTAPYDARTDRTSEPDEDDYFSRRATGRQSHFAPSRSRQGELVIVAAGKGGVSKSSTVLLLADRAAARGQTAVIVDVNRGQPDVRKYLRIGNASLRTAYDAYESGDPRDALLRPADYGPIRAQARLDAPDFAVVLGPPPEFAAPEYVSPRVYGEIIDYARSIADIVIVDTQILEAHRTDLWDDLLIPYLRGDAWLVGIADESNPGVANLLDRLTELRQQDVSGARTLILAAKYDNFSSDDVAYFQSRFGTLGSLIGSTGLDPHFHDRLNLGQISTPSPSVDPAILAILAKVTGRDDLYAVREQRRRGLFSGRRGRR